MGTCGYCGTPTRLTTPPARTTARAVTIALGPDTFDDRVRAVTAGQLPNPFDALLAALGHDVGRAELTAQIGAVVVPAHQDDLLGAEPLRGQHRRTGRRRRHR